MKTVNLIFTYVLPTTLVMLAASEFVSLANTLMNQRNSFLFFLGLATLVSTIIVVPACLIWLFTPGKKEN